MFQIRYIKTPEAAVRDTREAGFFASSAQRRRPLILRRFMSTFHTRYTLPQRTALKFCKLVSNISTID